MTHTYATLLVTPKTYEEIRRKLEKGGYPKPHLPGGPIDMQGIAIRLDATRKRVKGERRQRSRKISRRSAAPKRKKKHDTQNPWFGPSKEQAEINALRRDSIFSLSL